MRHNSLRRGILTGLLLLGIFLIGMNSTQQGKQTTYVSAESFESIIEGILSSNCRTRYSSTEAFRKFLLKKDQKTVAKRIRENHPGAFSFLQPLLQKFDEQDKITPISLKKIRQAYQSTEREIPLTDENEAAFSREYLTKLIANIETRPLLEQAFTIGFIAERAKFYSGPQLYSLGKEYEAVLENFVSGSHPELRILAASGLLWGNPQESSRLKTVVLEGLNHHEFPIRDLAFIPLKDQLPDTICYNPLDNPEERAKGVKAIHQLWNSQPTKNPPS